MTKHWQQEIESSFQKNRSCAAQTVFVQMITARLWCRAGSMFVFAPVVASRANGPTSCTRKAFEWAIEAAAMA